jgi:hypothetical protein
VLGGELNLPKIQKKKKFKLKSKSTML